MMKANNITATVYTTGNWIITIYESKTSFDAFLQHKRYGIASGMFGCPKEQPGGRISYEDFLELVEANLPAYVRTYKEEYCEE